jgi:hypothetical protein
LAVKVRNGEGNGQILRVTLYHPSTCIFFFFVWGYLPPTHKEKNPGGDGRYFYFILPTDLDVDVYRGQARSSRQKRKLVEGGLR